jgi:hypothetical protein
MQPWTVQRRQNDFARRPRRAAPAGKRDRTSGLARNRLGEVGHDDGRHVPGMMFAMGLVWLLVIIVLILGGASLVKYLRT